MNEIELRRKRKHEIVSGMVETYCRGNKHDRKDNTICESCQELLDYSEFRTSKCPYVQKTLFCSNCPTPCYKPDMKEKMRMMMKYSGPRYFFKHPSVVMKHVAYDYKTRKREG